MILLAIPLAIHSFELSFAPFRGISSVGRALAWHARGQRFDPAILHLLQKKAPHVAPFLLPVNDFIEQQFQHPGLHRLQVSVLLED